MSSPKIIIWVKPFCPWCRGVLDLLKEHGLKHEVRDVIAGKKHMEEMLERTGQEMAPCIEIDGHLMVDTDRDAVGAYLAEKGFIKKG